MTKATGPVGAGDERRVRRARVQVATALAVARNGRLASAERMVRQALGVLERRRRYAGAARAAATLSQLLHERGHAAAGATLHQARLLFDAAPDPTTRPSDQAVTEDEREDYLAAKTLLGRRQPRPSSVQRQPRSARSADATPVAAFAQDIGELLRLIDTGVEQTATARVCRWLLERTGATTVSCDGLPDGRLCRLAAVGAPRPPARAVINRLGAGEPLPLTRVDGHWCCSVIIAELPAVLTLQWSAAAAQVDSAWLYPRLDLASRLCETDVALALERTRAVERAADGLVGDGQETRRLRHAIARAAAAPYPVLIEGETGVGKELVARAIHSQSSRRRRPLRAVNCAALTDDLFEAEFFGYRRGAFTGATTDRGGLFEDADGGTLFLDEIAELSPRAQAKLLRVVQQGEIRRIGESQSRRVDVRLVAASNRPLQAEVEARRFRHDLFFRLAVITICVPPLRARGEDIRRLVDHCWAQAREQTGSRARLSSEVIGALVAYEWPGNVRQLQNVAARVAVDVPRGVVRVAQLPAEITSPAESGLVPLAAARQACDRRLVRDALRCSGGNRTEAARLLGLTRQGLTKLIRRLDL